MLVMLVITLCLCETRAVKLGVMCPNRKIALESDTLDTDALHNEHDVSATSDCFYNSFWMCEYFPFSNFCILSIF